MTSDKTLPSTPIAIVGIGCRFPKAPDADHFWDNIVHGRTAFGPIPKDRWNHDIFFSANQRDIDKSWVAAGSFIDSYREFAPLHFGIAPRRLEVMDPQQRLLIEATRIAIQDAGYETREFPRRDTGVYVGLSIAEFQQLTNARLTAMRLAGGDFGGVPGSEAFRDALMDLASNVVPIRAFTLPGSLTALASAAIAQTFDLGGPAYTLDSACASASIAVHDAVLQLRAGAIDAAVAGGAYLNLAPDNLVAFTKIGAISPSGVCRPFDHRADGFVQSDGVGMLFLKRLDDAVEDNDRIYAVIRGSGCNNDGRGEGPMTPRTEGQLEVLRSAYADADVEPTSVSYFEAHGTATSIGDPVEIEALGTTLLEAGASREDPVPIGSVKGNIGHAMSAAGIAGLVKVIKVLQNRTAPPQPGFESANPKLGLDRFPLQVPTEATELTARGDGPLRVAVSSFGFGGTNSHIVLEEAPTRVRSRMVSRPISVDLDAADAGTSNNENPAPEAVIVSAPTAALLAPHLDELADALLDGPARDASLADLAFTLNARRRHEQVRVVAGAKTPHDLLDNLRAAAEALRGAGEEATFPLMVNRETTVFEAPEPDAEAPKLAFLFPGQGAQRVGLLADVKARFPAFSEAFDDYSHAADRSLSRPLASYLYPANLDTKQEVALAEAALAATEVCQPAMAALGLATASLLDSVGVRPTVSLGHSLGEFAALANAGVMSPEDAVRLVTVRGAAMRALPLEDTGAMAAVMADEATVRSALQDLEGVWVANINHPRQVSISGTTAGVARATELLREQGLDVKPLPVSHAFHSPLVEGVSTKLEPLLDALELAAPRHVVASCIDGAPHEGGEATKQALLRHATSEVRFTRGLEQAKAAGATVFLQVGAGTTLTSFARATLGRDEIMTINLAPTEPDGGFEMVRGLCTLQAIGVPVDFEQVYTLDDRRVVTLPETPLERQAYWPKKDNVHPKADMTHPLPVPQEGLRIVDVAGAAPQGTAPVTGPSASLVELFAEQAKILGATAEIIAAQNRLLLGEGGPVDPQAVAGIEDQVARLMKEPAPAGPASEAAAPAPASEAAAPAKTDAAVDAPDEEAVRDRVFEVIAKISAFPRKSLRAEQRLVDELGFDSLMVADLGGALEGAYPDLGPLPPTLFGLHTTVKDLADHVAKTLAHQDDVHIEEPEAEAVRGPITRYRVVPAERAGGDYEQMDVTGQTWLVTEDGTALSRAISEAMTARGARLLRVRFTKDGVAAPSQLSLGTLNLWPEAFVEGLPGAIREAGIELTGLIHGASMSLADSAQFVNPVDLLHPLANQLSPAHFVVLTALGGRMGLERRSSNPKNVLQAALSGYAKALARERPQDRVRTFDLDLTVPEEQTAKWVVSELLGGDLDPEVGFDTKRWLPELVEVGPGPQSRRALTSDDVVVITGGAGEIGRLSARWAAQHRPKAVVLIGRRSPDADIEALLTELRALGPTVEYVATDITDKAAFRAAVAPIFEQTGEATVAFHAAGIIEDAHATKKSIDSVHRVMDVKVAGLQNLLRTFTKLEDVVLFSSWAGRFGNAGQTDYAAANDLLDRIAVIGVGQARVVSVVWPPWASTKMVRSIPATMRGMMESEGVTFIEDDEGLAVLEAIFSERIQGIEIVGRDLPARQVAAEHDERFALRRHPYLEDHRLNGHPVVPLASATDLAAWAFRETTGRQGPLLIDDLELVRGIRGDDFARVKVRGRRGIDAVTRGRVEILARPEGETGPGLIAYRGRASNERLELPSQPELTGAEITPSVDLETFYRDQTFHGPLLHGIESLGRMTETGIDGVVSAAKMSTWIPEGTRPQWTVDPLVLDGSFQLAGFWLFQRHGRAGFPTGFARLILSRPFGANPVRCRVVLGDVTETTFSGDIYYSDAEDRPIAVLQGIRGRFAEVAATQAKPAATKPAADLDGVLDETWQIAKFPEVEELDQRFQMAELMGLKNPYFNLHLGTARDTSLVEGVEMINYSSYNYLGFSGHPQVVEAAQASIAKFGTSVSASRVASGERPVHRELEAGLAKHVGVQDALVFVSGHATNVTTVGHLMDRNDLILHDGLIHDSILQGIYLSGATRRPFPHNDTDALEKTLSQLRGSYRRVLICAEGIYSMDGDICDLPRLIEIKKRYKSMLMIDEAHSIGVLGHAGRGIAHHVPGIDPNDVDVWMGTLSKSFASCGGYIAGSSDLIRYLKYTAPGFVYSAGIPPANAAAALKSLELMNAQPDVVEQCRSRSLFFRDRARERGIDTGDAIGAAVVPAIVGNSLVCMRLADNLSKRQINVQPIVYPAVEDEKARLRFFISALHTEAQLAHTVDVLVEELAKVRAESLGGSQPLSL